MTKGQEATSPKVNCNWCGQEIDALDGQHADKCYLFIKGERKELP